METKPATTDLAKYILPEELFRYFTLCQVEESTDGLHFHFDELNIFPAEFTGEDMSSEGFHDAGVIKDFPFRGKPLYLHVRRRRRLNKTTGDVVSRDWKLVAGGTHYTQ